MYILVLSSFFPSPTVIGANLACQILTRHPLDEGTDQAETLDAKTVTPLDSKQQDRIFIGRKEMQRRTA
jgi:hypothetical protein